MGLFPSAFFWGALVILIGLSIILNSLGVRLPLVRLALGLFVIWLGLSIVFSAFRHTRTRRETVVLDSGTVRGRPGQREYNTILGSGVFDLTDIRPEARDERIEVNAIFGRARVLVDPDAPVRIEGSAAFGLTRFPDGSSVAFGERVHDLPGYRGDRAALVLRVAAVFGRVDVEGVRRPPGTDSTPGPDDDSPAPAAP